MLALLSNVPGAFFVVPGREVVRYRSIDGKCGRVDAVMYLRGRSPKKRAHG